MGTPSSGRVTGPAERRLETTASLLALIRGGDEAARDRLLGRYLPALQRWAHGRLPRQARDLTQTDDLVQNTLIRALSHLERFEPRREGAFLAYLRQILLNQVRDEIRRAARKPGRESLDEDLPLSEPSPLEEAIGQQALERYEAALSRLPQRQQEALVLKVEMGFTNDEIAQAVGCATSDAARMLVARGMVRLAEEMDEADDSQEKR